MSRTVATPSFEPASRLRPLRSKWGWIVALAIVYMGAGFIALALGVVVVSHGLVRGGRVVGFLRAPDLRVGEGGGIGAGLELKRQFRQVGPNKGSAWRRAAMRGAPGAATRCQNPRLAFSAGS